MTTLISVHTSDGCVGRCDAKCHEATSPHCDCVCGGMNHGVGHDRAVENTRAHAAEMAEEYARCKELVEYQAEVDDAVYQLALPW